MICEMLGVLVGDRELGGEGCGDNFGDRLRRGGLPLSSAKVGLGAQCFQCVVEEPMS